MYLQALKHMLQQEVTNSWFPYKIFINQGLL